MIKPSVPPVLSTPRRHQVLPLAGAGGAVALAAWAIIGAGIDGGADPSASAPSASAPSQSLSASRWHAPPTPLRRQPAAPPQPCPDRVVRVRVEVLADGADRDGRLDFGYRVTERADAVVARLVVVNTGQAACTRDLGRRRELVLTSADAVQRRWLSADCAGETPDELRIMHPGEEYSFPLTQARFGRPVSLGAGPDLLAPQQVPAAPAVPDDTGRPPCPTNQAGPSSGSTADHAWPIVWGALPPAGDYLLTGRLGELTSEPVPVRLS